MTKNPLSYLTIGSPSGPHIEIISRFDHTSEVTVRDAFAVIGDPRTIYYSLSFLDKVITQTQIERLEAMKIFNMEGFFGLLPGNPQEDISITDTLVLFSYPPGMAPEEALQSIEIAENGKFSPTLAIGLLAVAPFFSGKTPKTMQGALTIGFVYLAGEISPSGISYLSEKSLARNIQKYISKLVQYGANIEPHLPDYAVDRAKFVVLLAETCWQPEFRRQIANARQNLKYIKPLSWITTPWLYLHPEATIEVSDMNIPIFRNMDQEFDPWIQTLEWDAHEIAPDVLQFMLPERNHPIERLPLDYLFRIPEVFTEIAIELTKYMLADIGDAQKLRTLEYFRLDLRTQHDFYFRCGIIGLRIHGNHANGFWVGLETTTGMSVSFWWSPQTELPITWITGLMEQQTKSLLHLTLACVWRDFYAVDRSEFPEGEIRDWSFITQLSSWKTIEASQGNFWDPNILYQSLDLGNSASQASRNVKKIIEEAVQFIAPPDECMGRTCLSIFLNLVDFDEIGF